MKFVEGRIDVSFVERGNTAPRIVLVNHMPYAQRAVEWAREAVTALRNGIYNDGSLGFAVKAMNDYVKSPTEDNLKIVRGMAERVRRDAVPIIGFIESRREGRKKASQPEITSQIMAHLYANQAVSNALKTILGNSHLAPHYLHEAGEASIKARAVRKPNAEVKGFAVQERERLTEQLKELGGGLKEAARLMQ